MKNKLASVICEMSDCFDTGDMWGSIMQARFDIAESLACRGEDCPKSWHYNPGAGGPSAGDGESYLRQLIDEADPADLMDLGGFLAKIAAGLESADLSY